MVLSALTSNTLRGGRSKRRQYMGARINIDSPPPPAFRRRGHRATRHAKLPLDKQDTYIMNAHGANREHNLRRTNGKFEWTTCSRSRRTQQQASPQCSQRMCQQADPDWHITVCLWPVANRVKELDHFMFCCNQSCKRDFDPQNICLAKLPAHFLSRISRKDRSDTVLCRKPTARYK
jgi:hypothetical protein